MTGTEKIAAIFIAILLFLCIVLSLRLLSTREKIGEGERTLNRLHNKQITLYSNQIHSLNKIISTLQAEVDSLTHEKEKVRIVTIHEIDSVARLPFDGRANFWSIEAARIDSVRYRYLSRN